MLSLAHHLDKPQRADETNRGPVSSKISRRTASSTRSQKSTLPPGRLHAPGLGRLYPFHQQEPPVANDRRAAADPRLAHAASAGENPRPGARPFVERGAVRISRWANGSASSSRPKPTSSVSMPSSRLEGADDRDRGAAADERRRLAPFRLRARGRRAAQLRCSRAERSRPCPVAAKELGLHIRRQA